MLCGMREAEGGEREKGKTAKRKKNSGIGAASESKTI